MLLCPIYFAVAFGPTFLIASYDFESLQDGMAARRAEEPLRLAASGGEPAVLTVLPSISDVIDDAVHRYVGGPSVLSVELRQSIGRVNTLPSTSACSSGVSSCVSLSSALPEFPELLGKNA